MIDTIEIFGNSTLQHGRHSNRVYLMSLAPEDLPEIVTYMESLATAEGYTKIFAKVPATVAPSFRETGFKTEAKIPRFFKRKADAHFMGKYLCPKRKQEKKPDLVQQLVETAQAKEPVMEPAALDVHLTCRRVTLDDAGQMAELYRQVFASYPFPIHDPAYLIETMEENVIYHGIWDGPELLALASAEMDRVQANAEMTDFATRPDCRGKGLAQVLLAVLEETAAAEGIRTAYTIARSYSAGMNITFAKNDYQFSGTLTNNTNISGGLESMNVWHKPLS
ncbi:MAG: putative beta-lysine N-acetyltransferase [Desulfuromonadaceae bacterium GWC2_58_13]|nr:MAG: putative beta-lysine N-acetyltransferase [Desulfuromonadaceae bacterium GWC2_58_13]